MGWFGGRPAHACFRRCCCKRNALHAMQTYVACGCCCGVDDVSRRCYLQPPDCTVPGVPCIDDYCKVPFLRRCTAGRQTYASVIYPASAPPRRRLRSGRRGRDRAAAGCLFAACWTTRSGPSRRQGRQPCSIPLGTTTPFFFPDLRHPSLRPNLGSAAGTRLANEEMRDPDALLWLRLA